MKPIVSGSWWVGHALNRSIEVARENQQLPKNEQQIPATAITAGLGSGKTHGGAQLHHLLALHNQEAPFSGWMEPTYTLIKLAAIPTYKKVLESFNYREGRDYDVYISSPPRIVYRRSGHQVVFISGDNPNNVVAFELSHASIDEAGACNGDAQRNFRTRVRHPKAKILFNSIFGAPQGINAFADEFDSDTLPDWEAIHWRYHRHAKKPFERLILWTDDNPELPGGYIGSLMDTYGHNPNLIKSYRYGLFSPLTEGVAVPNYIPQKHDLTINIEPDPFLDIDLTWDFNNNPLAWVSVQLHCFEQQYGRAHKYVGIHEANEGANQIDDAVLEFERKHPVEKFHNTQINLFGDRSGHSGSHKIEGSDYQNIEKILRRLGYKYVTIRALDFNPPEPDSVEALQRLFLNDYFYLNPRLKKTKKSLLATAWQKGIRKLDKPAGETWTHWFDALKYFAYAGTRYFIGKPTNGVISHIW